jgi:hypothetical protein
VHDCKTTTSDVGPFKIASKQIEQQFDVTPTSARAEKSLEGRSFFLSPLETQNCL